jgi:hypothetical protein
MKHKFFPLDKNYILKEAQAACKTRLLKEAIKEVKYAYHLLFNPLGLEDDTTVFIQSSSKFELKDLEELYEALAGIYRFKYGSNQLEFLFDGRTHFEKYSDDWSETFLQWIREYAQHPSFVRAVLDATIFYRKHKKAQMAGAKLRAFICDQMNFKFRKSGDYIKLKISNQ